MEPGRVPEMAVAVLSYRDEPTLPAAVRSILAQGEEIELIVINSGGGDAAARLAAAGSDLEGIPVVEVEERLFAGAARNLAIRRTRAPYIAFLAADCLAEPGWVSARLAAHRRGASAVASAVVNPFRGNVFAWAAQIALYSRRMPRTPVHLAQRYGASYARSLFDRFGGFREDLRAGEDTRFHGTLRRAGIEIVWEPAVRTAHRHPESLAQLLRDQWRRGSRAAAVWVQMAPSSRPSHRFLMMAGVALSMPGILLRSWQGSVPADRAWILASWPLVPVAGIAFLAGALLPGSAEGT